MRYNPPGVVWLCGKRGDLRRVDRGVGIKKRVNSLAKVDPSEDSFYRLPHVIGERLTNGRELSRFGEQVAVV